MRHFAKMTGASLSGKNAASAWTGARSSSRPPRMEGAMTVDLLAIVALGFLGLIVAVSLGLGAWVSKKMKADAARNAGG
jgi:hypothetical protein